MGDQHSAASTDFVRPPGLFRRWELEDVLDVDTEFLLEDAGKAADGTQLLAVYSRPAPKSGETQ